MRKVLLLSGFLFFIFSLTVSAQQDWYWKSPNPQGNQINKIFAANNSIWGIGDCATIISTDNLGSTWNVKNRLSGMNDNILSFFKLNETTFYLGTSSSQMHKTTNAGMNWTMMSTIPNHTGVTYLYFTSSARGFITTAKTVYSTTNGGSAWLALNSFEDQITSLNFINDNTGFITTLGSMEGGFSKIFKTTNAGVNWQNVFMAGFYQSFKIIKFTNESTGFMHFNGTLYKTLNEGMNWSSLNLTQYFDFVFVLNSNEIGGVYQNTFKTSTDGGLTYNVKTLSPLIREGIYIESLQKAYILGVNNRIAVTENSGDTWTTITEKNGDGSASDRLLAIKFVNTSTGFVAGWNRYFKKTTDAGNTWTYYETGMTGHLNGLDFTDENTGYITGGNSSQAFVRKTTNGGINFTQIFWFTDYMGRDVKFINQNTGCVTGLDSCFRTSNAGVSWTRVNFPDNVRINAFEFINNNTGFATGRLYFSATNKIYKTTDAGISWQAVYTTTENLYKIKMIDANTGYIGGSKLFKTVNSGNSWSQMQDIPQSPYIYGVEFLNEQTGFVSGSGFLYKTTNGGTTWGVNSSLPTTNTINSIKFFDNNTGILIGDDGMILKTTNGGGYYLTEIVPINNSVPDEFILKQNYPNPFNPVTNINFSLPKEGFVSIKVYDVTGRMVKTLVNEVIETGNYTVTFDGSQFASGIYFYRLETNNFMETKRMMLVK